MPPIRVLDPNTVAKIAAGEVIQQPFNVVKELIENATDADAPTISLFVSTNCYDLIMVCDTGHGIDRVDYALLCHRFATSKITTFINIYDVQSFGFRGEALASISYVSRMIVISKVEDEPAYVAVYMDGKLCFEPKMLESEHTELFIDRLKSPSFTIICVTDLFYAEPIRRNQIRSSKASIDMQNVVVSVATAHPTKDYSISFISDTHAIQRAIQSWPNNTQEIIKILFFIINNSNLSTNTLHFKSVVTRSDRISQILSVLLNKSPNSGFVPPHVHSIVKENVSSTCLELSFYFTEPIEHTQQNKRLINLLTFINGRGVQYTRLKNAIQSVLNIYITSFSSIQAAILWVVVNPGRCDPNVHPSKEKVLLLDEDLIYTTIIDILTQYMKNHYVKVVTEPLTLQPRLKTRPQLPSDSSLVHNKTDRRVANTPSSSPRNTSSPLYKQRNDPSLTSVLCFENVQRTPRDKQTSQTQTPFTCNSPLQLPPHNEFNTHENKVDCDNDSRSNEPGVVDKKLNGNDNEQYHESIDGDINITGVVETNMTVVQQVQDIQTHSALQKDSEPPDYLSAFDRKFGKCSQQSRRILASTNLQGFLNNLPIEYNPSALPSITTNTRLILCGATVAVDNDGRKILLGFLQSTELALVCINMGRLLVAKMLSCYCSLLGSNYLSQDIFYRVSNHKVCSKELEELLGDHMFGIIDGTLTLAPHILVLLAQNEQNYMEILRAIQTWKLFPCRDAFEMFLQKFITTSHDTFAKDYAELLVDTLMNNIGQYPSDLCLVLQSFSSTLLGDNEWCCYVVTEYFAKEVLQSFNRIS